MKTDCYTDDRYNEFVCELRAHKSDLYREIDPHKIMREVGFRISAKIAEAILEVVGPPIVEALRQSLKEDLSKVST